LSVLLIPSTKTDLQMLVAVGWKPALFSCSVTQMDGGAAQAKTLKLAVLFRC